MKKIIDMYYTPGKPWYKQAYTWVLAALVTWFVVTGTTGMFEVAYGDYTDSEDYLAEVKMSGDVPDTCMAARLMMADGYFMIQDGWSLEEVREDYAYFLAENNLSTEVGTYAYFGLRSMFDKKWDGSVVAVVGDVEDVTMDHLDMVWNRMCTGQITFDWNGIKRTNQIRFDDAVTPAA